MESKIKIDSRALYQSGSICAAAGTILQIALGEVVSLNKLVGTKVMSDTVSKKVVPDFKSVLDHLKFANQELFSRALQLERYEKGEKNS